MTNKEIEQKLLSLEKRLKFFEDMYHDQLQQHIGALQAENKVLTKELESIYGKDFMKWFDE